ncbi:DNA/RNA nuclease SfsA [Paucisalibacillus globulus]|uniref:DNA/RNA nuclease SfsA n=1 Tax=Paucisalibacillus globulus TaxID=351095 RepID=UPI000402723B|nr:DNA/RNA nuclease SfsA [Paucisalibacillus globulus]
MKYGKMVQGILHRKVNRFIAEVLINGVMEKVHIRNTGRLRELLVPNAEVYLELSNNPNRKTRFSLVAVMKENRIVNIDSQAPNVVAYEAIKAGGIPEIGHVDSLKREVTYGDSRFDLFYEKQGMKGFIEIKGVTLEVNGLAMFPDAPTVRGTKHIKELVEAKREGYMTTILFVVQMQGCQAFTPNMAMDEEFANALNEASQQDVQILAYDSIVKEDELNLNRSVTVLL